MSADLATLRALDACMREQRWADLVAHAEAAATAFPDDANVCAYAAHALRQLGTLDVGYRWALRGVALDPRNAFAQNRRSLLANLTGQFDDAYAAGLAVLEIVPTSPADTQNVAVTLVNAIHAAAQLDRIVDAIARFADVIARLDHPELHYNSACLYALANDQRAFDYMHRSLAHAKPKAAFDDADFDRVRADPRFADLLSRDWPREAEALERAHKRSRDDLVRADFLDPAVLITNATQPIDTRRAPAIEAAIDDAVGDPAAYSIYTDWFLERDHVRGALALAERRCDEATAETERMLAYGTWASLIQANAGRLLGPLAVLLARDSRATWRYGVITELLFDTGYQRRPNLTAHDLLTATLALPVCRFLRELRIGDIFAVEQVTYDPVVEVLRATELPHLRVLAIGPRTYQMSWTTLDATDLAAQFPALEELELAAGELTLGDLDLPRLRRLALRTGGLARDVLEAVLAAAWPALEEFELWFGSSDYGADDLGVADLTPILAGLAMPTLVRLRLRNAEFTDAICDAIVGAPILRRLTVLDLSMGTLGDEGAAVLIAHATKLAHLSELSVEDNAISEPTLARLVAALPNVKAGSQKTERYVTVGE